MVLGLQNTISFLPTPLVKKGFMSLYRIILKVQEVTYICVFLESCLTCLPTGDALPIQVLKQDRTLSIDEQPWPEEDKEKLRDLDFGAWQIRHSHARVSEILQHLVIELQGRYPNIPIVGAGYCFGGKHVLRLAKTSLKAAAAFHPSFVEHGDLGGIKAALYVGLAEKDDMVPATLSSDLPRWAHEGLVDGTPFELAIYSGMRHGFAARPDTEDESIRQQYESAFKRTVQHFLNYA
jgi:hypothetical protein